MRIQLPIRSRPQPHCRGARCRNGPVASRLVVERRLEAGKARPPPRHLDHIRASAVHTFRNRAVDNVLGTMAARHPHLTAQKRFYAEIDWAHEGAELIIDGVAGLRAQLHPVTGERLVALEDIGEMPSDARGRPTRTAEAVRINGKGSGRKREQPTFANRVTGNARAGAEPELVAGPRIGRPASVNPENPCENQPGCRRATALPGARTWNGNQ